MEAREAAEILSRLLGGYDPETAEVLPETHVCREPEVREALTLAMQRLLGREPEMDPWVRRNGKLNAGRPWTQEDDEALRALVRQGCTMEQLCSRLIRRKRGILHRLEVLGIMLDAPQTAVPAWPEEDAAMLRRCVEQRLTMAQMAAMFGCSVQEIQQQLYAMGILQEDA